MNDEWMNPLVCRAAYSCPDHRLAHAACPCYENDDEAQYTTAEAGTTGASRSWTAVQPMRRRLSYLVPSPSQERKIPLAVQKYMHSAAGVYVYAHKRASSFVMQRAAN